MATPERQQPRGYGSHHCPQCGGQGSYRDEMGLRCVMCGYVLVQEMIEEMKEAGRTSQEEEP